MKIITQGRDPKEEPYRIHCNNCGTVFEFQRHEAQFHTDQRDGDFLSINCPVCAKYQTVTAKRHGYWGRG